MVFLFFVSTLDFLITQEDSSVQKNTKYLLQFCGRYFLVDG